ncbi:ethylene-responsive transcription factor ERF017-like [Chenopodium quinoa]|uniref:ethylene-responsive transcription factor ERF017-like n=1 Tax=Chenopodium quinoa TaxID=63459 RepID=UPI000B78FEDE|nr:ethylene-responsive transcription factor ERF017-like [Chenopodium quinoa]
MVKKSPEYQPNDSSNINSIKYKGVRKRKWGKWVSEIRLPNSRERIWLGSYDTAEKAARAFDAAQFCLRGKSANFNFPENPPDIAGGRSMTPSEIQVAASRFAYNSTNEDDRGGLEENPMIEESGEALSYSPSMSDGTTTTTTTTTTQMDSYTYTSSFEVAGVEASFQDQLSLSNALGSGNYVSDFGYLTGFDDFTGGDFFATQHQSNNNFDYVSQEAENTYDASLYQDSYLWNF